MVSLNVKFSKYIPSEIADIILTQVYQNKKDNSDIIKRDTRKGFTRVKSYSYSRQQEFELSNKNFHRTGPRETTEKSSI